MSPITTTRHSEPFLFLPRQPLLPGWSTCARRPRLPSLPPNPMLQGALLMQQMQGNMRGFGMGGQQFRQFFAAGTRSSLLGPVPMGMAMKSHIMGFPAARPYHPHARYYNNNTTTNTASSSSFSSVATTDTAARQPDRKRDSEQMTAGSTDDQPADIITIEASDKTERDVAVGGEDGPMQPSEEQLEEPVVKKQKTEGSEEPKEQCVVETVTIADTDGVVLSSECNSNSQPEDCVILEEGGSGGGSDVVEALEESGAVETHSCSSAPSPSGRPGEDDQQDRLAPEEMQIQDKDTPLASPENHDEGEEGVGDTNKFYCYLCSITCHNQQNFRGHMNSVSHQQRMMEIQHMSNACLVTLLPRIQESLQGANRDGDKKADTKHWCATCHTHYTSSIMDHRRTEEHKLASRTAISSCTVCKKHFRTSQIFVEHLQSQEHRQMVEKLQEKEGCEALGKLTSMDADGFLLEEVEGIEVEEGEERQTSEGDQDCSEKQDGWSSLKEVTLKDMASDEQYDPDTVYGSSFFVPVAGFICRLCNKFYHFESSALHTHCKSLKHFENLKNYRELMSQKGGAVESSGESLIAAASFRPGTETTTDCDDTGLVTDLNSMQPTITLTRVNTQTENQQQEEQAELDPTSQDFISTSATSTGSADQDLSLHSKENEPTSQASAGQESPAELPAGSREEPDSEQAAADEDANEEEEKEKEAPGVPGKKNGTGKAKSKRRSGRATNRH
ncbi:cdkn1a interacting zinc finger protein 1a [Micropterus salmoides]|uniref:cdkn1a interacting zinc finger protein 1a n=1 Tax=Micropterus salmoides TaxID=27706 RepID=UPI0018EB688E|nr:cdkn1a interacting zinc finger protein 1a [Micropterus salmoides]